MSEEIYLAFVETMKEILKKEKQKAIEQEDYFSALVASVVEGFFREAEKSIKAKKT